MEHKRLKREAVRLWVKELLINKGSQQQKMLLKHTLEDSTSDYFSYIKEQITKHNNKGKDLYQGDGSIPSLLSSNKSCIIALTPGHMYMMPTKDIIALYNHWESLPYADAADYTFWGAITLSEIDNGVIKPVWLATDSKGNEDSTKSELDLAISGNDEKKIDGLVRRILRWMMAPSEIRGAAGLYANCSLAKAWWCGYIANQLIANQPNVIDESISFEEAVESLKDIWPTFADYIAGKLSVIAEPSVSSGIIYWAREKKLEGIRKSQKLLKTDNIKAMIHQLGKTSSWCLLGLKTPEQIHKMINTLL